MEVSHHVFFTYLPSVDEVYNLDYDPHEHIKCQLIMKNWSEKYYLVRNFSDISEINEINTSSQS
jgi:hypothetical protein